MKSRHSDAGPRIVEQAFRDFVTTPARCRPNATKGGEHGIILDREETAHELNSY